MTPSPKPCVSCRKSGRRTALEHSRNRTRYLVFQHADWEKLGYYGELLDEHGMRSQVVRLDRGDPLPRWQDFDAIIAMGGPMSVNDHLPWLSQEIDLVADAVAAGRPFFGTCLGAQILAAATGARVYPGPHLEVGMHRVTMTPDSFTDPVFGGLPRQVEVMQWHGETFDLPAGAVPLASSPGFAHQAMRVGEHAYGVQFHLEISRPLLAEWLAVPGCRQEAQRVWGPAAERTLEQQLSTAETRMARLARRLFTDWLAVVAQSRCAGRAAARRGLRHDGQPQPAR